MASTRIQNIVVDFLVRLVNAVSTMGLSERSPEAKNYLQNNPVTQENVEEIIKPSPISTSWVQPGDLILFNYSRPTTETHLVLVVGNERTSTGIFRSSALNRSGVRENMLLSAFKLDSADIENSTAAVRNLYKKREITYRDIVDTKDLLGSENYRTYLTNRNYMSNFNEVEF
jgi:hypothetical protein